MLTYCTNVHPSETLDQLQESLARFTRPVVRPLQEEGLLPRPFPLGLYLSAQGVRDLGAPARRERFQEFLDREGFAPGTFNCFPFGGFREDRVKERVFQPGWHEDQRVEHTKEAARVVAAMLAPGSRASISTLSGTLKAWEDASVREAAARNQARAAEELARIQAETGVELVLCLEPEPFSTLETSAEVVEWFQEFLWGGPGRAWLRRSGWSEEQAAAILRRHLGVCYDTCHQAVEFEDVGASLGALVQAGVRVAKVQLSSALRWTSGPSGEAAFQQLREFQEQRYLHQTFVREVGGRITGFPDLDGFFQAYRQGLAGVDEVRTHFHVPIHLESMGLLRSTRRQLEESIRAVRALDLPDPDWEVETYTFDRLPSPQEDGLIGSIQRELRSAATLLG